jgi:hypothetical protein
MRTQWISNDTKKQSIHTTQWEKSKIEGEMRIKITKMEVEI